MAKSKLKTRLLCVFTALAILSAGAATSAFSFSWFTNRDAFGSGLSGSTSGAYFARGSGTKDDPYVINKPIHLYNLAWLQDIGYFDHSENYFIVESDLDMSGWTLPPIGTKDHPFTGHFDGLDTEHGNNKTAAVISNLTMSNSFGDFSKHPSSVKELSGANAMGFFGTFGEEKKDYADGASPSAKNFYLKSLNVKSSQTQNLIGLVGGYVNGELDSIGVSDSKISLPSGSLQSYGGYTDNLSDFAAVGYTPEKYRYEILDRSITLSRSEAKTYTDVENNSGSETGGNGGSIDMNAMYTSLLSLWNSTQRIQIPTKRTIHLDKNGNLISNDITETSVESRLPSWSTSSGYSFYYGNNEQRNSDGLLTSSYSFAMRSNTDAYMYLYGEDTITANNLKLETTTIQDQENHFTFIVSDSNYLSLSNGAITNNISSKSATAWKIDDDGHVISGDDTPYYLVNDWGVLSLTQNESEASKWTYDSSKSTYVNGTSALQYSVEQGWHLEFTSYKTIADLNGNYWVCLSSSSASNSPSLIINYGASYSSSATQWHVSNDRYFTYIDGTKYFLGTDTFTNNSTISGLTTNESNAFTFAVSGSKGQGYFSVQKGTRTYRMSSTNNSGGLVKVTTDNAWEFTLRDFTSTTALTAVTPIESALTYTTTFVKKTESSSATYSTNPTYFPISNTDGVPNPDNTGYVVSGANSGEAYGDVRVSEYSRESIGDISTIRTINDSGTVTNSGSNFSSFSEYEDTLKKFQEIYNKNEISIYGLHFMNAEISTDHLVKLDYASFKNEIYQGQDYELPQDCIDFRLMRKGFVNFFAGTYFDGNDSFFSLHEIERDSENPAKIKAIQEIEEILSNPSATKQSQSYVYKYADGTYSVPFLHGSKSGVKKNIDGSDFTDGTPTSTCPEGYTKTVFKTSWIKRNTLNSDSCYYFEIPCNAGEYALGSVSGGTGAYLCYLDIGANAQRIDVTEYRQKQLVKTLSTVYPKGVSFSFIGDSGVALPTIDPSSSAFFALGSSFSGDFNVSMSNATSLNYTSTSSNVFTSYKGAGLSLTGNGSAIGDIGETLVSSVETDTITQVSYSLFSDETSTTIYQKTSTTDENGSTSSSSSTIKDGEEESGDSSWPADINWNELSLTQAAILHLRLPSGETLSLLVTPVYEADFSDTDGTHFYKLSGYTLKAEGAGSGKVTLTSYDDTSLTLTYVSSDGTQTKLTLNLVQEVSA